MKDSTTTDWNLLLSTKGSVKKLNKFAVGTNSSKEVATSFASADKAKEFRNLVRNHGTTYARRLTRKALRYRGLMK